MKTRQPAKTGATEEVDADRKEYGLRLRFITLQADEGSTRVEAPFQRKPHFAHAENAVSLSI
ncbi:MAG: hypothetical protein R3C09_19755 [Pirellulaceae bacterium]